MNLRAVIFLLTAALLPALAEVQVISLNGDAGGPVPAIIRLPVRVTGPVKFEVVAASDGAELSLITNNGGDADGDGDADAPGHGGVLTALGRPKPSAPDPRLAAFSVAEMVRRTTAIYESATERARR